MRQGNETSSVIMERVWRGCFITDLHLLMLRLTVQIISPGKKHNHLKKNL